MNKLKLLEFMTGFLMGAFLGVITTGFVLFAYNLSCRYLLGCALMQLSWWHVLPLPLIFGVLMGKSIAAMKLGDY